MKGNSNRQIFWWLIIGCVLIFTIVIVGGITRLSGSGLSIVEWDVIMGTIPPLNENEWNSIFDNYKKYPQYQIINYEMTVSEFKTIFWWEYIHRVLGRLIGVVFIIPFLIFLTQGKINKNLLKKLLFIFALGALQGLAGWWMVKSGLVDKPSVSAYRLTFHLLLALILYSFIFYTALTVKNLQTQKTEMNFIQKLFKKTSYLIMILVFIQMMYGGFMAGLKAGLFYPSFPKMKEQWIPDGMLVIKPLWKNLFENITTVQFIHRYLGLLLLVLIVVYCIFMLRMATQKLYKNLAYSLLAIIIIQVTLGILTLLSSVQLLLGVLHQIVAVILLTIIIYFNHQVKFNNINLKI